MDRKKKYIILIAVFLAAFPITGFSQNNLDSVKDAFKRLTDMYSKASYLSFNMNYTYAAITNPSQYLDSLSGKVSIGKGFSHMELANTETICDSNYSVILFKDEKVMYLSRAISKRVTYNPVAMLDSFLSRLSFVNVSIEYKNKEEVITIIYPPGTDYKSAEFFINPSSGLLDKTIYKMKSYLIVGANGIGSMPKSPQNDWGIMQCNFSNYQKGEFNNKEFSTGKYFKKDGKEYQPTDEFKQYKIFIGSLDL